MDFCYLVNPFFPNKKLIRELRTNFETLLCNYPSGMGVNSLLAAKYFSLHSQNIVVGNGAAELIKALMENIVRDKIGLVFPTFEEYPNRLRPEDIVAFYPQNPDFSYTADDLMEFFDDKQMSMLALINPDNPSGNYIPKNDVLRLIQWSHDKGIRLIVDESFVDFAETSESSTLLEQSLLEQYPYLIVVKSISKSYGVPGLRLGVLASGDSTLIDRIKKDVSIWNINSFAEYYMQIFEKYRSYYKNGMERFYKVRRQFVEQLKNLPGLRVIPSQANYVMCEVIHPCGSALLTEQLLTKYNILIKDLSSKKGFSGRPYVRIAVKRPEENEAIVTALKEILQ